MQVSLMSNYKWYKIRLEGGGGGGGEIIKSCLGHGNRGNFKIEYNLTAQFYLEKTLIDD